MVPKIYKDLSALDVLETEASILTSVNVEFHVKYDFSLNFSLLVS